MQVEELSLPGVLLITPVVHRDERGFFIETHHAERYREAGIADFVQDNHSRSQKGTLRGLHYQWRKPQGKLVRCIEGEIYDVAVDIRTGSPNFGKWTSAKLSAENCCQLYVPPGYAHGFCVVTEYAQVEYKCTDFYDPGGELSILWNDPALAIPWPLENPVLSKKDIAAPPLAEVGENLPVYQA